MPCWFYFGRPTNTAFHNFCEPETRVPENLGLLLGLGMKFIPTPFFTCNNIQETTKKLQRSLELKTFFAGQEPDNEDYDPKIYIPSKWKPKPWMLPRELTYRLSRFRRAITPLFRKQRGTPNLLPAQRHLLHDLRNHEDLIIVDCDKNLGPAVIERSKYIFTVLDHLSDILTYQQMSSDAIQTYTKDTRQAIIEWQEKYNLYFSKAEKTYLNNNKTSRLPYFYMTIKAHKNPWSVRPITACRDTILSHVGTIVDRWLQQVAETMPTYIKNSTERLNKTII